MIILKVLTLAVLLLLAWSVGYVFLLAVYAAALGIPDSSVMVLIVGVFMAILGAGIVATTKSIFKKKEPS